MSLAAYVRLAALRTPGREAVRAPDGTLTYRELDGLSNRFARALAARGVRRGDRVGLWASKSRDVVAMMQASLRLGAAYVPLDPASPRARIAAICADGDFRVLVSDRDDGAGLGGASIDLRDRDRGALLVFDDAPLREADVEVADDDLAYVLYTSGSTGVPKGVCLSHRNARAFVDWAATELAVTSDDVLSNHAPFHFDLSVFDLYAAFAAGACVALIPDGIAYAPERLVAFAREQRITVWYSVPSALILMMERGAFLDADPAPLRAVVFAGEPFPMKHLRRLRDAFARVRLLNFYGPTETNVCTFHEVFEIDPGETAPPPIGRACAGDRATAVTADERTAGAGEEGELLVEGPTVMLGYWGKPPHSGPYRTGDVVRVREDGAFVYVGRRDAMVKVRGYRIELGDVESALLTDARLREAAVVVAGTGLEAKLVAFVTVTARSGEGARPSILELKRVCAERLPRYMIIDRVRYVAELPRTNNGKVDRRALAAMLLLNAGNENANDEAET